MIMQANTNNMMRRINDEHVILVNTGELHSGDKDVVLKSSPIGSCVVVVLFDYQSFAGAVAHIMLPGFAPEKNNIVTAKYAGNAIESMIMQIVALGVKKENLKAVIVGGGNVLKRKGDTIGAQNIASVVDLLHKQDIPILKSSVGGTNRKSVRFDLQKRIIYYTEGDSNEMILFNITHENLKT